MPKQVEVTAKSNQPLPVNATPRERFQADAGKVRRHQELVDSPDFVAGADVALLEYGNRCATLLDPTVAGLKYAGAVEFLNTFKLLAEKQTPAAARKDPDNLPFPDESRRK